MTTSADPSLSAIPCARNVNKARLNSPDKVLPSWVSLSDFCQHHKKQKNLPHGNLLPFLKSLGVEMVSYAAMDNQYYLLTSIISSSSIWVNHQTLLSLGFLKRLFEVISMVSSCSLMLLFPFSTWDHSPFGPKRNNGLCFVLNRTCSSLDYQGDWARYPHYEWPGVYSFGVVMLSTDKVLG